MCDRLDLLIEKAIYHYMKEEAEKTQEELKNIEIMFCDIAKKNKKKFLSLLH